MPQKRKQQPISPFLAQAFDTTFLHDIGLSPSESQLFLALLKVGPKAASELSKLSGITRTNTYNVLSQLEGKGIVERRGGGTKTIFAALHPRRLEQVLETQEQRVRASRNALGEAMQSMIVDYSLAENHRGLFQFEGKAGMIRVYEELLKDRVAVNSIVNRQLLRLMIADYNPEYIRKRIRNKIKSRVIAPWGGTIEADDTRELREVRYLDPETFPFGMDLKVTEKKIVMTTFEEKNIVGIIINDPAIIKNYLILFNFLWTVGKRAEDLQ